MAGFSKPQSVMTVLLALFALLQLTVAAGHGHRHNARHSDAIIQAQVDEIAQALAERETLVKRDVGPYISTSGVCSTGVIWWGDCNNNGRTSSPRLEIRQLRNNGDQWNLYLLGMERFMSKSQSDRLGYYQIAGIHGRPFTSWNGGPLINQAGYCPHGQVLFGSWHRPYLAIFEQAWYLSVMEVINDFPSSSRQRWYNAAATLRMPYWDWAQDPGNGQPTVPTLIRDQQVSVTKPQGQVTIDNPLYSYSWGGSLPNEMGGGPWDNFPRTLRRPVANPTRSNNNEMNARFDSMRVSLRDRVFALFSSRDSWGYVSTSQIGARTDLSGSGVDSFESVHDAIHNTAGGDSGGHMYYLDVSSFDPIFWLHHTNVDRLLTMYQYIRSDTWVAIGSINRPMAQWNEGQVVHGGYPLIPFRKSTWGDYYNSDDVRETRNFGYYYPETSQRSYQQVAQAVTNLYGAGVRSITKRDNTNAQTGQYLGRPFEEGDYHTVATITADKFALEGSYTVHCFIGSNSNSTASNSTAPFGNSTTSYKPTVTPTPQKNSTRLPEEDYDPSQDFTQSPDYVGAYGVLGGMRAGGNSSTPLMTRGSLPLTTCLQGKEYYGYLKSLKPEDVEPYLQKNFYYKVIGVNGEIDPKLIPNFHISIQTTKVTPAKSMGELPDLSAPYTVLTKATENLPAGKPYTYTPKPNDYVSPDPRYGGDVSPNPSQIWSGANGQCALQQVIKYVYPDGKPVKY